MITDEDTATVPGFAPISRAQYRKVESDGNSSGCRKLWALEDEKVVP
jgi:hypothetical protein